MWTVIAGLVFFALQYMGTKLSCHIEVQSTFRPLKFIRA
uniref:Uncharacterized protein n=1 Tax=Anguilla anguilla TaxID=7936 RepID=A0A0E9Q0V1_ANGAN